MKINSIPSRTWFKVVLGAALFAVPGVIAASFGQAADEHHVQSGLPTIVILQFVNFFIYVGLIVFFGKKPIADYFKNRQAAFHVALKRADAARAEAQAKRADIQTRLSKLEATRDESIQSARKDAAELRTQIVNEAKALSVKLQTEAERTAVTEVERAKLSLREDLLNQSVQMAQRILSDKMQDQDQKRLQDEFVTKIQPKNAGAAT